VRGRGRVEEATPDPAGDLDASVLCVYVCVCVCVCVCVFSRGWGLEKKMLPVIRSIRCNCDDVCVSVCVCARAPW
jgi:hypothetical protein